MFCLLTFLHSSVEGWGVVYLVRLTSYFALRIAKKLVGAYLQTGIFSTFKVKTCRSRLCPLRLFLKPYFFS